MKKNKIVKILIIIVLLLNVQLPSIAETTGVISADTVRVREDATTKSNIIGLVSVGDKIKVIAKKSGDGGIWYKVEVNNEVGYIRNDLITVKEDVPYEDEQNGDAVTTPDPNETEEPDNNGDTTNEQTPPIESNDKSISTLKSTQGVTVGQNVKLTETIKIKLLPSANSTNIAEINENTQVTVLEVINSWCRIETEGACGWVRIGQ